jgi:hypothetical protein
MNRYTILSCSMAKLWSGSWSADTCTMLSMQWLMLATGPGYPPGVRALTGSSVWFGSSPGQKPEPLCLGVFVTRSGQKPAVFWPVCNWTAVLLLRVIQLWLKFSVWVPLISRHDEYVGYADLASLLPPAVRFTIGPKFIESRWNNPILSVKLVAFR